MMNPARWLLGATSHLPSEPRTVDGENQLQPSLDELQVHGRMTWSEAQHRWIAAPDDVVEALSRMASSRDHAFSSCERDPYIDDGGES